MGFSFRIGHAGAHRHQSQPAKRATPNASCSTGGFYISPSNGASVDSLQLVPLKWDTTCLSTTNVDIYALAPGSSTVGAHIWNNIPFDKGEYSIELQPKWWSDGPSQQFQIAIVPAGSPLGLNTLPAGPVITATYTAPADGKLPASADMSATGTTTTKQSHGVSAGGKAAAVLIPLLLVIGLGVAYYVRRQRLARNQQSKRFSEALDKRMSTISTNWQSISAAGAQHAIRNSIATTGRNSMAIPRPLSSYDELPMPGEDAPQMQQVRTGTGVGLRRDPAALAALAAERASRVSRVSFAADTINRASRASAAFTDGRPSLDSRKNRPFHQGHVPPLPNRNDIASSVYPDSTLEKDFDEKDFDEKQSTETTNSPVLSPRQKEGALPLNPADIPAKVHARNESGQSTMGVDAYGGYEEVGAALSLVQTNNSGNATDGHIEFPIPMPASPAPTYSTSPGHHDQSFDEAYGAYPYPTSTATSAFSPSVYTQMPTPPAAVAGNDAMVIPNIPPSINPMLPASSMAMSPDEMLRAYAERRGTPGPHSGTSTPVSSPPPSSFSALPGGSPKGKGRKLSLRKSLAALKKEYTGSSALPMTPSIEEKKAAISQPTPIADAFGTTFRSESPSQMSPTSSGSASSNMAGVGARKNSQDRWNSAANDVVGAPPPATSQWKGAQYTIGEDDED